MEDKEWPLISIITPVYNSGKTIAECLKAIVDQDYPKEKLEIIMPDGGSTDSTLKIIEKYKTDLNITVCNNPLKTGEAGKSVGIEMAKGEIIALIDSDNIMPDDNYVRDMVEPFLTEPDIIGTEPLFFFFREKDKPLTKYFAMSGVNDPLCLFIGNYDKYSYVTGKWTGFDLKITDKEKYFIVELDEKKIPTIGANGTFLRKECLLKTNYKPYMFDIDVIYEILKTGKNKFVKVKTGIIHVYSPDIKSFIKKQSRRIYDFLFFSKEKQRTYPWSKFPVKSIFLFVFFCVTILPLFFQMTAGFIRKKRWEWIFHPVVCWITLIIYGWAFLKSSITRKTTIKDRSEW
ncbi:MAG: glycosyltransferase family 2 protein [Candidatus Goldbacteria bacterium]|nr:glycosyltransferase family 2 protein [Candidatus Goldiibacteriota bacterium]